MKKILSIILCMTGLLVLSNCSKDEEITTGTINGLVSDMTNANTAIPGATVTLSPLGLSKTTGSDGRYEFTDVAPGSYTISVSANNYQSDTKSVTVYAGQIATADFQLGATSTPVNIEPMALSFGPDNNSLSFVISNKSERSLQYSISGYPAFISVTPASAQIAAMGRQTVMVTVNRASVTANQSFQLLVNVGNDSYPVSINVNTQDVSSKMSVTPTTLDFGEVYAQLQFTIRNVGTGGDLTWNISEPTNACFTVSPKSGTTSLGGSQQVTVTLDRSKMTESIPAAFINVNTDGGSTPVTVTAIKTGSGEEGGGGTIPDGIVVKSGLQAYYMFDDGTANDATEYGLDGQLFNGPSMIDDTPSGRGQALFINTVKGQYMNVPYNPLEGFTTYTISLWIKDFSEGAFFKTPESRCEFGYSSNGGFYGRNQNNGEAYYFSYNAAALLDNQWHMVTYTYKYDDNSPVARLYVDGKRVDSKEWRFSIKTSGTSMLVNCNMKMDNLRVYNRMLDDAEVLSIYNSER